VRFIYTFVPTADPNMALYLVDGDVLLLGSTRPNGELIEEDADFPPEAAKLLRHIIVAHHGMREKGSPVVPQTREAIIVHYCDDMTARIGAVDDAEAATPAAERWSGRIFMIDAPAYFGPRDEPDDE